MDLEISDHITDGVRVLDLSGVIKLGDSVHQLRSRLKEMLSNGDTQLVLDMSRVRYVDSAGLGALVAALTTARNQAGNLKFARVGQQFREQLVVTKLVTVFELYGSVDEALKSFAPAS